MATASTAPLLTGSREAKPAAKELQSIDDVMEVYMGGTGALQLLKAVLVTFAWAFDAQQVFISAFTDAQPQWHCLAAASTGNSSAPSCSPVVGSPCALPAGSWAWDRPADTSVVSEWALSCGGPLLASLPASSFFAGNLAGGFLLATLADSLLGRKKMLLVSLVSMSVAGVLTALAPNVWAYAALRLVSGFVRSMVGTCALVLSTELVGRSRRGTVNVAGFLCFAAGFLSLPALAYAFRDASWRTMYLWTSAPCLFYSLLLYLLVQESPRWLLVRGRKQDAIDALRQIMSLDVDDEERSFSMLDACMLREEDKAGGAGVFAALQDMWERRWALRRLAAIMAASFGVGMVYLGMPLNLGSLGSNLYLTSTYNALAEVPSAALAWLLVATANRRVSVMALTAASGACSLACAAVAIPPAARMAAEVTSFLGAVTAFDVILIYATELFPTSVRNSAVGMVRQALFLWSSFGVFGLAIGCFGLFLPETKGRGACQTARRRSAKRPP
ncbi:hypothetical protein HU200_018274 [Digitaria exilis]|uniref:Major facilitator superfamily (MFS) profile domain-containing protein n=1 Tax=Digitaria exilis TaxID=1010633 RepID=A0A835KFA1_9POAL|nr:hypothetical protein HU200_018274 [Digitaria exilis]CAB3500512.1 unnamed protein product [Digitaria exilis]